MNIAEVPAGLDQEALRSAITEEYTQVATSPDQGFHFHTGRPLAALLKYDEGWLDRVPESSIESFAGTGNPFLLGRLKDGERVLDVGSGAGMDSLIAGHMVGPSGHVTGVDMTDAMLARARSSATEIGATNVEFVQGVAEALPSPDSSVDVVISNGVFNLVPAKAKALQEMYRVLKPGGRLQVADIVVSRAVPLEAKEDIDLWTGWIAGALLEAELEQLIGEVGFIDFEITWKKDIYAGAAQESSALAYGTKGITFRANKPGSWATSGLFARMTSDG